MPRLSSLAFFYPSFASWRKDVLCLVLACFHRAEWFEERLTATIMLGYSVGCFACEADKCSTEKDISCFVPVHNPLAIAKKSSCHLIWQSHTHVESLIYFRFSNNDSLLEIS